jgi:hypothetical protein
MVLGRVGLGVRSLASIFLLKGASPGQGKGVVDDELALPRIHKEKG